MDDLVPTSQGTALQPAFGLSAGAGTSPLNALRGLTGQAAVRRALPWFGGVVAIGALALTWSVLSSPPQRLLYSQLDDAQRADIVGALDKASIPYRINNNSGALTVNEEDLYQARMIVASDGALATPESGIELLDSLPLGASRTLEGERVRAARIRELTLTIQEIDAVEAVRVHLAEPEKSVFVRKESPPTASVMLRLAKGRQLSDSQVVAIANLVASSVSGMPVENVRIVDQHGQLLSQRSSADPSAIDLQAQMEEKLRTQINQLLAPVLGLGNFSSEVQVELDMEERTTARESFDNPGVVRQETQEVSGAGTGSGGGAVGVPGMLSNTPPPAGVAQEQDGVDQTGESGEPGQPGTTAAMPPNGPSRSSRSYEIGREVAVINAATGGVKRMSVAVALSSEAMEKSAKADVESIKTLVSAALGANPERGDQVEVVVRSFAATEFEEVPFYETGWFASLVRYGVTLLGLLLVLLLAVRPLLKALRGVKLAPDVENPAALIDRSDGGAKADAMHTGHDAIDRSLLNRHVGAAQKFAEERPDRAAVAIRQMLSQPEGA